MGSLPPLALAGAIAACVGVLLHIIGLATLNWINPKNGDGNIGLFRVCAGFICGDSTNIIPTERKAEYKAIQAMCILGMIAGFVAAGAANVFVLFTIMSKSKLSIMGLVMRFVTLTAGIASFVFITIGVIIYETEIYDKYFEPHADYGFSFGLTITGGILLLIGSIIFFIGAKSSD